MKQGKHYVLSLMLLFKNGSKHIKIKKDKWE